MLHRACGTNFGRDDLRSGISVRKRKKTSFFLWICECDTGLFTIGDKLLYRHKVIFKSGGSICYRFFSTLLECPCAALAETHCSRGEFIMLQKHRQSTCLSRVKQPDGLPPAAMYQPSLRVKMDINRGETHISTR